jgi:hypothetical protein
MNTDQQSGKFKFISDVSGKVSDPMAENCHDISKLK